MGGILPIEVAVAERKRLYSANCQISPESGKVLRIRCNNWQVTLRKWKEQLSGSSKGKWTHLLIRNLMVWLKKDHRQMDFCLTQVMFSYVTFNVYLLCMRPVECPECANCYRR